MRTSYSAIETYLQCPQRYKFQQIDKIRVPKSAEAIFGTLIHSTLHFMFQKNPLFPTLDEVVQHFREHWPSRDVLGEEARHNPLRRSWSEDEEKVYFEEGVRMLKRFYEKNAPWNYVVVDLESRFEVALADETSGQTHLLVGIIDRIDKLSDNTFEIIDYKTTRRMPSQESLGKNLQLSLYALGLQKRWPHLNAEEITLSLYFLKHGEKLSVHISEQTIQATKEQMIRTISEIQSRIDEQKQFEPTPGPLCDWCGYKPICPAWRHLYRKTQISEALTEDEIDPVLQEYFSLKKQVKEHEEKLAALQEKIKSYMEQEALTRVFGKDGVIAKKTMQRYGYDLAKVKAVLEPIGKWEIILKADEQKLKQILKELPEDACSAIMQARHIQREYSMLTASLKAIKRPL
ncbi:MAG: PD-(D/E)XK nuclease family protein [Candidatus Sungbacteria bacterium]|nr:PD-(D/E)XK nuclease family protein [Candidatus Sungbacteria bacterium]